MDGNRQHVDSDGNRVNVGNFDSDGLNVNNNWDENRNDNIGVASARKSHLFPVFENAPPSGAFSLPFSAGFDPPAEHASDLVHRSLESRVFLIVDSFYFFHESKKYPQKVQLHADLFENRQFLRFVCLAFEQYPLEDFQDYVLAFLPNGMTILLLDAITVAVERLIEIIGFLEDRYVEVIHNFIKYEDL